jgi:hypothetical protein
MGRRSRKRGALAAGDGPRPRADGAGARREPPRRSAAAAAPTGAARRARPRTAEAPRAPWHPFPLTELCVLIGLVLLVWGVIRRDDPAGRVLLVCGMALGSLGGLETALREHFSGVRSHSSVLAGLPAVLVAGVLFFARAPWIAVPVAAATVFAVAFAALRRAHRRVAPAGRLG